MKKNINIFFALALFSWTALFCLYGDAFFTSMTEGTAGSWNKMASVIGVSLGVSENPYNTLAQNLKNKEAELASREEMLLWSESEGLEELERRMKERENSLLLFGGGAILILFFLVIFNFYLDRRRGMFGSVIIKR